jgi:hypothetical protein
MKLIDEALLDQARSKALARRRSNRGATVLLPSQAELVLPLIGVGGDLNSPARYRRRTVLGRVGAKLVDRHRKRDRSGSSSLIPLPYRVESTSFMVTGCQAFGSRCDSL